jgi:hypothetical protein
MTNTTKITLFIIAMLAITTYAAFKIEVDRFEEIGREYLNQDCAELQLAAAMGFNVEYRVRNEIREIDKLDISWFRKAAAKKAIRHVYDDCLYN